MLVDGHCHPTDHPEQLDEIATLDLRMAAMSTRLDDLALVEEVARQFPDKIVPAFGLHPWYTYLVKTQDVDKTTHYQSVLDPPADESLIEVLPEPVLLADHVEKLRQLLERHPSALLGEVGLDRQFKLKYNDTLYPHKVTLDHQRTVLRAQLELATKLGRSASLHGVGAHQALFEEVARLETGLGPVCLHSYGGSPDFYKQCWRKLPIDVYLSMAPFIADKLVARRLNALLAVAEPRLVLSESDMNRAGPAQVRDVQRSLDLLQKRFSWENAELQVEENFGRFIART